MSSLRPLLMDGIIVGSLETIRRGWRGFGRCVYKQDFEE